MFRLLREEVERVSISVDGVEVSVPAGVSLAAALLNLDHLPFRRTPVSGRPRAPFCMMGLCFECLVEIDGEPGQRACQRQVSAGMQVRRAVVADGDPG